METSGHWEREVKPRWDSLDFRFPKPNPYGIIPSNEQGVDSEVRSAQIEMRSAVMAEAYSVVKAMTVGKGSATAEQNRQKAQGLRTSYHELITME